MGLVQHTNFVATGVEQRTQVDAAIGAAVMPAGGIVAGAPTSRQASGVGGIDILGRHGAKACGAHTGARLGVEGDGEGAVVTHVKAALPLGNTGRHAEHAKKGVVKLLGLGQVVHSEHDVAEHGGLSLVRRRRKKQAEVPKLPEIPLHQWADV